MKNTIRTSARITCKDCGKFLGMYEGWYDKCEDCRVILPLIQKIKDNLTDDLLKKKYIHPSNTPLTGHCYVATECFYYLYGKDHGWKPVCKRLSDTETHWWLEKDGEREIIDITAQQFPTDDFNYRGGHKQFFVHYPSKRCLILARRVQNV